MLLTGKENNMYFVTRCDFKGMLSVLRRFSQPTLCIFQPIANRSISTITFRTFIPIPYIKSLGVRATGHEILAKLFAFRPIFGSLTSRDQILGSARIRSPTFDVDSSRTKSYNAVFAQVHDHGMVVGLKNNVELLTNMVNSSNFAMRREYDNIILLLLTWQ